MAVYPFSSDPQELARAVARFASQEAQDGPVFFGSEGKPEAVVLPYAEYAALITMRKRWQIHDRSTGSVEAEGLGNSPEAGAIEARWIRGEISADEMYHETLKLYQANE